MTAPAVSRQFTILWIVWAVCGVGSAVALIVAHEIGVDTPRNVWAWWAIPGVLFGGTIEIAALIRPGAGDTLSEHVWQLQGGWRSLVVVFVLWVAWWLATGVAWPSAGIFFLVWCAWHFAFEAPTKPEPS